MAFDPKVSIIIPVYNGSNYLREAIDSALAQTYKNIEVIVVNDGSNDDGKTEEIAKSYVDRIRYFYKRNGGIATALNMGIRHSVSDYISWLSHDDMYLPCKVERQIDFLSGTYGDNLILYSDFKVLNVMTQDSHIERAYEANPMTNKKDVIFLLYSATLHGCTLLIPKACFNNGVDLFNESLKTTQDYEMWFRLVKKGYEFRYIPEPLIVTRWHKDQGIRRMHCLHRREADELYIRAYDTFREDFKTFPVSQIIKIVILLKKRSLIKSSDFILRGRSKNIFYYLSLKSLSKIISYIGIWKVLFKKRI